MKRIDNKFGQVWVETVIYTLIGLAIIGIVLAGALPKINEKKDEMTIEQSINALSTIDDKIYEIQRAPGNRRVISLEIKSGSFVIDPARDRLMWILESSYPYSDIGFSVPINRINVTTREKDPGVYEIELLTQYSEDIRYNDQDGFEGTLASAPVPYNLIVENLGREDGRIVIDFSQG